MSHGLYIHLPFCKKKCPYCHFISITNGTDNLVEDYITAITSEFKMLHHNVFTDSPQTIYIGGGTPSLVPASSLKKIIDKVLPDKGIEFTVEANPDSLDDAWLDGMLSIGANRISIGIQSLNDDILKNLGRIHTAQQSIRAVERARNAGFSNISVDLLFGVPGQTLDMWEQTLIETCALNPSHISGYSLSIEEDTEYYHLMDGNNLTLPSPDETADMYFLMCERLKKHGFRRYELSNFAYAGYECQHNMAYWNFIPYLGLGVSSHSYDGKQRRWNTNDVYTYASLCHSGTDPISDYEVIDDKKHLIETIMLSLRTFNGLDITTLLSYNPLRENVLRGKLNIYNECGLIVENDNGKIFLTNRGAMLVDEIIAEIICDLEFGE
jgi:oxygen-independent coproporphyrinogen III oxidase